MINGRCRMPTKKNFSTSNFFNKKHKSKKNIYSSKNLLNIQKFRSIKRTKSRSERKRRYSIPNNRRDYKSGQKLIFINNFDLKNDSKDKKLYNNNQLNNERKNQIWNIGKIEINNIYKVDEEEY